LLQLGKETLKISTCDLLSKDIKEVIENFVCILGSGTERKNMISNL